MHRFTAIGASILLLQVSMLLTAGIAPAATPDAAAAFSTTTPIKHLVVIFNENISFDHYFGTYPVAANLPGEPSFVAAPDTPTVNGLTPALLTRNRNTIQPMRIDRAHALTCDQDHNYAAEQHAYDRGLVDRFVEETEGKAYNERQFCPPGAVMGYFDGNTVTALWNYAQDFAMSDAAYASTFGQSTAGTLHLAAGDVAPVVCGPAVNVSGTVPVCGETVPATSQTGAATGTLYIDSDPYYDDCSQGGPNDKSKTTALAGPNAGDLLNAAGVTWGWFEGGFADCASKHPLVAYDTATGTDPATDSFQVTDYIPHHEPFQYYPSTANPHHLPPTSTAMVGYTDQANHQYDLTNFWAAADSGNLPAVSFLKPPAYQDAHGGYSDPLDEQAFLVDTVNRLQQLPEWASTVVVIGYDDSDGWYDHVLGPILNHSATSLDFGCGVVTDGAPARCGYGPRLPYLVISPYARENTVDHSVIDQTSTLRFIEDNWLGGQRISPQSFDNFAGSINGMFDFRRPRHEPPLLLDPMTGKPATGPATPVASPVAWKQT
ncbi:MAG: phospholipase C [Thermomicrobiales bacterium]